MRRPRSSRWRAGSLRKLTSHNDALIAELQLGATEDVNFKSKDGTEVHGMHYKAARVREPARNIRCCCASTADPNGQDQHSFNFERQFFAANGYVVLNVNYRGSSGRGSKLSAKASSRIGATKKWPICWPASIMSSAMGIADPDRLGIGGWSYGGILTDYTIATRHTLQSRDQRRGQRQPDRDVRRRPVHVAIR